RPPYPISTTIPYTTLFRSICPGDKIKLSKIDPDDTGRYNKEEALQRFSELREKIDQLQEILYAERRRSLLLIFQAMDTGGKDGRSEEHSSELQSRFDLVCR